MRLSRLLVASAVTAFSGFSGAALADRMPPPTTTICNKTKKAIQVAAGTRDRYVGWNTHGWSAIAPRACRDFQADAFHIRGKRRIVGLAKHTARACVRYDKIFRITARTDQANAGTECAKHKGHLVTFHHAHYRRHKVAVDVFD